jgi:hypothetical protein
MADRETAAPVTIQELLITTLATADALAQLLIQKSELIAGQLVRALLLTH